MDYVTTNIRIPRNVYLEIKEEAHRKKKSFGAIVRDRLEKKTSARNPNTDLFMKRLDKLAKKNGKYFKGNSASDMIIEMRYEQ